MPIYVNQITDKQLQEVLSYTESHFLDIKAKEIKPSKLTKTISAFANADGGEVYVGKNLLRLKTSSWNISKIIPRSRTAPRAD